MYTIVKLQDKILNLLANKIDDFYLAGGTALSKYYFHHRISYDIDFFTKFYSKKRIDEIVNYLKEKTKKEIELKFQQTKKGKTKMATYYISELKIDFVEDEIRLLKPLKNFNGIYVLSLEDIYLRKIYAICGIAETINNIGRKKFIVKREEAKDFYDLYCLSEIFMNLSDFIHQYCDQTTKESLITWFRTYNRMDIISGLLDLSVKKRLDYKKIEQHFKREIDAIIEREIYL